MRYKKYLKKKGKVPNSAKKATKADMYSSAQDNTIKIMSKANTGTQYTDGKR